MKPFFGLVILSGASDSRSESLAKSKDPYSADPIRGVARHSHRTLNEDDRQSRRRDAHCSLCTQPLS